MPHPLQTSHMPLSQGAKSVSSLPRLRVFARHAVGKTGISHPEVCCLFGSFYGFILDDLSLIHLDNSYLLACGRKYPICIHLWISAVAGTSSATPVASWGLNTEIWENRLHHPTSNFILYLCNVVIPAMIRWTQVRPKLLWKIMDTLPSLCHTASPLKPSLRMFGVTELATSFLVQDQTKLAASKTEELLQRWRFFRIWVVLKWECHQHSNFNQVFFSG